MTRQGRELIIELERVRLVRRRVATVRMFCNGCSEYGDFVTATRLAAVFEIPITDHLSVLGRYGIHTESSATGIVHVCSRSLLAALNRKNLCSAARSDFES